MIPMALAWKSIPFRELKKGGAGRNSTSAGYKAKYQITGPLADS
jgi:hypothetical protein